MSGNLEPRHGRSTLSRLDDALLVGAIVVAAIVALQLISWIAGAIVLLVKLAVVAAVIVAGVAWVGRRR